MFFDSQHRAAAERQAQLQQRSSQLRQRLGEDAQVLQAPLALADQVRSGWRWLKAHPEWVGAGVVLLVVLRPRRMPRLLWRLGSTTWTGWQLWRRARRWAASAAPLLPPRQR